MPLGLDQLWIGQTLTPRELKIAQLYIGCSRVKDVVKVLNSRGDSVALKTVDVHLYRVRKKLGVHSRQEVADLFFAAGITGDLTDEDIPVRVNYASGAPWLWK